ncbi:MAG: NAD(+)/NADH kinase [Candidatus Omnitrophica bacterium]|nr:NAD(+)/NADH kinase [Candidatus Omnitrophota bacterium]
MPKILIIYNAKSGHKQVKFSAYCEALTKGGAEIEVRTIAPRFNLKDLLADAGNFERVVVAGGDGTVSAAAGLLQNTGMPIVAYPGGTASLLALNLGMPANAEALAEITLNGRAVPTDLGEIEYLHYSRRDNFRRRFLRRKVEGKRDKIYFSVMAGCGFSAQMVSRAQSLKPQWGQAAYWLSAFLSLFPRRAEFHLLMDGREVVTEGLGILIINFEKIQFDLKLVGKAHARDGKVEIMIIKSRSLFGLIPVLWAAICERLGFPRHHVPEVMETYQTSEIEIASLPSLRLQYDGEILKKTGRFKVRVCRGAAMFVYGAEELTKVTNPGAGQNQETH